MTTAYCSEDDLVKIRPDIMDLGVSDWSDQIEEAGSIIDRAIDVGWYRAIAENNYIDWRTTPFDRELLLNLDTQLKRLGSYKTLELAFLFLKKYSSEDAFEEERKVFRTMYQDELNEVLTSGFDYDWDEDDEIDVGENVIPQVRRLVRV